MTLTSLQEEYDLKRGLGREPSLVPIQRFTPTPGLWVLEVESVSVHQQPVWSLFRGRSSNSVSLTRWNIGQVLPYQLVVLASFNLLIHLLSLITCSCYDRFPVVVEIQRYIANIEPAVVDLVNYTIPVAAVLLGLDHYQDHYQGNQRTRVRVAGLACPSPHSPYTHPKAGRRSVGRADRFGYFPNLKSILMFTYSYAWSK